METEAPAKISVRLEFEGDLARALERYRKSFDVIPTRAEATRQLVACALDHETAS
jgi:hypothetical protein